VLSYTYQSHIYAGKPEGEAAEHYIKGKYRYLIILYFFSGSIIKGGILIHIIFVYQGPAKLCGSDPIYIK